MQWTLSLFSNLVPRALRRSKHHVINSFRRREGPRKRQIIEIDEKIWDMRMTIITYQYFAWPFVFIILVQKAALASLKKKNIMTPRGSVTAGHEMLRLNLKNLEVGLGKKKTDPISAIPHTFTCSRWWWPHGKTTKVSQVGILYVCLFYFRWKLCSFRTLRALFKKSVYLLSKVGIRLGYTFVLLDRWWDSFWVVPRFSNYVFEILIFIYSFSYISYFFVNFNNLPFSRTPPPRPNEFITPGEVVRQQRKSYFWSFWIVLDRFGVVVGRWGSFWIVVDRFGSFWVVPRFSNYDHRTCSLHFGGWSAVIRLTTLTATLHYWNTSGNGNRMCIYNARLFQVSICFLYHIFLMFPVLFINMKQRNYT